MIVYPIKIGSKENNKETDLDKQRKKALKVKTLCLNTFYLVKINA